MLQSTVYSRSSKLGRDREPEEDEDSSSVQGDAEDDDEDDDDDDDDDDDNDDDHDPDLGLSSAEDKPPWVGSKTMDDWESDVSLMVSWTETATPTIEECKSMSPPMGGARITRTESPLVCPLSERTDGDRDSVEASADDVSPFLLRSLRSLRSLRNSMERESDERMETDETAETIDFVERTERANFGGSSACTSPSERSRSPMSCDALLRVRGSPGTGLVSSTTSALFRGAPSPSLHSPVCGLVTGVSAGLLLIPGVPGGDATLLLGLLVLLIFPSSDAVNSFSCASRCSRRCFSTRACSRAFLRCASRALSSARTPVARAADTLVECPCGPRGTRPA